ncbi:hypothetical protein [Cognatishimia maritima]|uniref:O-antigen ligase like membrane protein n=1 Tax=Cognatishimia maritima TaxID=870908 RepID=A0A1M5TUK6_9RHOB|nr:hypothetical protein [Cognatishimia maritima]SHH54368.1 hypothetical protein SAMN04488044_2702 [Cognatishimia maritima]
MPNSIAYIVLAAWPLVMFVSFKRMPVGRALIWSFLGAYLLLPPLPTAFDFPLMPPLNKLTLPNLAALFMVIFVAREKVEFFPQSNWVKAVMLCFIFSPALTVLTNPEPVLFAQGGLRGLYAMDIVALVINQAIILIGFVLARQFLFKPEHLRDLLMALMIAGVVYSFPMLLEVRLSPQLNIWIYGYFQHVFEQMIRAGGYRAIVFLSHGIWAAFFIMTALSAAVILWRNAAGKRRSAKFIAGVFLAGVLVLNKTLSPVLYAMVLIALVVFANWKIQARVALLLAVLTLAYPLAKLVDIVPEEQILAAATSVSAERANSLQFRFDNENLLFERAMEKPLFGWGSWGRNHLHDPIDGTIRTVTDGRWIIAVGVFGWIGFLAEFGLLAAPIFAFYRLAGSEQATRRRLNRAQVETSIPLRKTSAERQVDQVISQLGGGLSLLLALNLVDLLPNATLTPITWLIAGALLGYCEQLRTQLKEMASGRRKSALEASNRITVETGPRTIL